ncbi:MAG: ThiF family adenylyltransferase [Christensenellales bacterium]
MNEQFSRSALLLGEAALERLKGSHVAVFGLGGVGGYAAEGLARAGIGHLTLIDGDRVTLSNLNRQIIALHDNVGRCKAELMRERVLAINPLAQAAARVLYYTPDLAGDFDLRQFDYVLDCVDMVTAKVELAWRCQAAGVRLISAMGAGNKLDPGMLSLSDISKTSVCPLARVMRKLLKQRGIDHLQVVYSRETPREPLPGHGTPAEDGSLRERSVPGSLVFVPAAMGMMMAAKAVSDLAQA